MTRGSENPVVVVGAGLAGLACVRALHRADVSVILLEASDGVGGRVRTDRVESDAGVYLIDRGFQVYLTAYPEGRRVLRASDLGLRGFVPGAMVRFEGRFWRMVDPLRAPWRLPAMLRSPLLTALDVPALALLETRLRLSSEERCWKAPEQTTEELLRGAGISDRAIDRFFRPFFGGVFLDRSLKFSVGHAALPVGGMQTIPDQLATGLAPSTVRTGQIVSRISPGEVTLDSGGIIHASAVVVATDGGGAASLVHGMPAPG